MNNNQSAGTSSHLITLTEAADMTLLYRDNKDDILNSTVSKSILPLCETFSRGDLDKLLEQTGCEGVRIYLGMKEDLNICAVIVGVNENDEDMVDSSSSNNIILENGDRCPTFCPPKSPLN